VLRAVALGALLALLWRAWRPPPAASVDVARGDILAALARWTTTPPGEARVLLDVVPDARTRAWARALVGAGTPLRWSAARPLAPSAIVAEPAVEPNGGTRVRLAAASGTPVSVGDEAGMIDSLPRGGAAELELTALAGGVHVRGATFRATTVRRDSVALRPVLVLGAAGWEAKFVIAALEERGWRVSARMRVAPAVEVTQGALGAIDTARYSAVVALDSSAASSAGAIARYARDGGGVILAGTAARLGSLSSIAPGSVGRRMAGVAGAVASDNPRAGLGAFAIGAVRSDAVALESRAGAVTLAARRVDAGRVVQSGYDETWRWRMSGGDEAASAHRAWWSRLVSAVAYASVLPLSRNDEPSGVAVDDTLATAPPPDGAIDEAPLAALLDALGPPATFDAGAAPRRDHARTTRILFALVVASLLLEWTSRRLRGAR
jgi:hypothetical protein